MRFLNEQRNKKFFWFAVLGASVCLVVILFAVLKDNKFEYAPSRENSRAGPIVIKAKSEVDPNAGSYTIEPEARGHIQIIDKYIIFWPDQEEGFAEREQYTATLKDYRTLAGEPLKIPTLKFVIDRDAPYHELQKEVLAQYGDLESTANPFLVKLPHTEPYRYTVTYSINHARAGEENEKSVLEELGNEQNWREKKNNYLVFIETHVFQGQQESLQDYHQEINLARAEALAWITSQGVDINKDINYQFIPDDDALAAPLEDQSDVEIEL